MPEETERTWESKLLDKHPDVRNAVLHSKAFQTWKDSLPSVSVDGVQYSIIGGDMLQDEDQVVFDWAYRTGLISDKSEAREPALHDSAV